MAKLLALGALLVFIYVLFKGMVKHALRKHNEMPPGTANSCQAEKMVQCSRCGIHMPESESIKQNGNITCRDVAHCIQRP